MTNPTPTLFSALTSLTTGLAELQAVFEQVMDSQNTNEKSTHKQKDATVQVQAHNEESENNENANNGNHKANESAKKRKVTAKKVKEEGMPKKPKSAYIEFCADYRKKHQVALLTVAPKEQLIRLGQEWSKLTEEERKPFETLAETNKAEYQEALRTRAVERGEPIPVFNERPSQKAKKSEMIESEVVVSDGENSTKSAAEPNVEPLATSNTAEIRSAETSLPDVRGIENLANVERLIGNLEEETSIHNSKTSSPAHSNPERDSIFEDEETMEDGAALTETKKHKSEAKKSKSKKDKKEKRSHDETSEERKERKRQKKLRKELRRESRGEH